MDIKELTTFRAIVQEGTFAKAAAKLNYAQSTVTNQIQRLEKELGIKLFERGWDARLTAAGKIYAEEAERLIRHWHYVRERATALQREEIGTLDIGVIEPLASGTLPALLRRFREMKPNIACRFAVGSTDCLARSLSRRTLDFAVCGEPEELSGLRFEPLYREKISFIAAKGHPLAVKGSAGWEELCGYPLIVGGKSCLYHKRLEKQLSGGAAEPFQYTISQLSAIPFLVRGMPAVGAVLSSMPLPPDVVPIEAEMANPYIPVGILESRRNEEYRSSAAQMFLQALREELSAQGVLREKPLS